MDKLYQGKLCICVDMPNAHSSASFPHRAALHPSPPQDISITGWEWPVKLGTMGGRLSRRDSEKKREMAEVHSLGVPVGSSLQGQFSSRKHLLPWQGWKSALTSQGKSWSAGLLHQMYSHNGDHQKSNRSTRSHNSVSVLFEMAVLWSTGRECSSVQLLNNHHSQLDISWFSVRLKTGEWSQTFSSGVISLQTWLGPNLFHLLDMFHDPPV